MSETTRTLTEAEIELSNCHDLMDQRTSAVGAGYKLARRIVEEFTRLDDEAAAHAQAVQRLTEERDLMVASAKQAKVYMDSAIDDKKQAEAALAALRVDANRLCPEHAETAIAAADEVLARLRPRPEGST